MSILDLNCFLIDAIINKQILDMVIPLSIKKKQVLFAEGDDIKGLYFIVKGRAKVEISDHREKQYMIKILIAKDIIGYNALFRNVKKYNYSVSAIEDMEVLYFPNQIFKNEFLNNLEIMRTILQYSLEDQLYACQNFQNVVSKSVRERVASTLIILQQKLGISKDGFINIELQRDEIASLTSTTVEATIKYLSEFKNEQLIEIIGRKIKILDLEKFTKTANDVYYKNKDLSFNM